jgi:GTPase
MSSEKVAIAGLRLESQKPAQFVSMMAELKRLVDTAGGFVAQEYSQSRPHPEPATYLGRGKLEEMAAEIKRLGIKTVVFDDDLTAGQQKNTEKILHAKVVDRTRLILDIFAQRARTREGQLQVELAQLTYAVPRLTGAWRGFSQQMGGIGTRGPGERKIEVERRHVRDRIKRLKQDINDIRRHRERAREGREAVPIPQVALVGYTNAGKSTLLNALVGEGVVYADDKLFATLDPTTRRVKLPDGRVILITDTVGFIQKLPAGLMAAFQATLEEVSHAALLVHVVDASSEQREDQIEAVNNTLEKLNTRHVPVVLVYNKADVVTKYEAGALKKQGRFLMSAKNKAGLPGLLKTIENTLDAGLIEKTVQVPHSQRHLVSSLYKMGHILKQTYDEKGARITARLDENNWKKIIHQIKA